jgi:SAM-dependent methyltransferase
MNREYLNEVQYKDSSKLAKRANLHMKYGRNDWFPWIEAQGGFAPGMSVLDIGCGAGWFWSSTAQSLPADLDITLADMSEGMVAEALERVRGTGRWQQVTGQVADVCKMPFADASFDRVMALHMLYHAEDQPAAIAEIARVMKPDGVALVATNGGNNMATADALRQKAFDLPDRPVINFMLENAPPLLGAQFGDVELRPRRDVMNCTEEDDLFGYLTSFPPGDSASEPELAKLHGLVAEGFRDGGGVFAIPVETGVFLCRK